MPEHGEILAWYVDLWKRIEADDVYVCYREKSRGEGGYFEHDGDAIPPAGNGPWRRREKIALCRFPRPKPDDTPTDLPDTGALESELLTLCHEYGHCLSYRGATDRATWERYHQAAQIRRRFWWRCTRRLIGRYVASARRLLPGQTRFDYLLAESSESRGESLQV